jgi:hypothetical protein
VFYRVAWQSWQKAAGQLLGWSDPPSTTGSKWSTSLADQAFPVGGAHGVARMWPKRPRGSISYTLPRPAFTLRGGCLRGTGLRFAL